VDRTAVDAVERRARRGQGRHSPERERFHSSRSIRRTRISDDRLAALAAISALICLGIGVWWTLIWDDKTAGLLVIGLSSVVLISLWAWARTLRRIRRRFANRNAKPS
jgi:hypothetical protein